MSRQAVVNESDKKRWKSARVRTALIERVDALAVPDGRTRGWMLNHLLQRALDELVEPSQRVA